MTDEQRFTWSLKAFDQLGPVFMLLCVQGMLFGFLMVRAVVKNEALAAVILAVLAMVNLVAARTVYVITEPPK